MTRTFATAGTGRAGRAVAACAALTAVAALATACSGSSDSQDDAVPTAQPTTPGRLSVQAPDVDLDITDAVAHLDAAGNGTLTMTVRNGSSVPEHLDMVATPGGGRGSIVGGSHKGSGALETAGISLRPGTTVVFGGSGNPVIRFTAVGGVTAAHTLPLALEFGVARLVHLTALVATS
jgi:copper(I)-binding protein